MDKQVNYHDEDHPLSLRANWRAIMWIAYLGAIVGALYSYNAL